jgi:hypothetical protein
VAAWRDAGAHQLFWIREQNNLITAIYPDNDRA